jgi:hypothetical protein
VELLYYFGVTCLLSSILAAALTVTATASVDNLAKRLGAKDPPLILHVGIPSQHARSHIPGAILAGPGFKSEGLQRLKATLKDIPRDRDIVIYCGCCPWKDCPNIAPAFKAMREAGFKNVRALELPTDFWMDWEKRGLPVEASKKRPP